MCLNYEKVNLTGFIYFTGDTNHNNSNDSINYMPGVGTMVYENTGKPYAITELTTESTAVPVREQEVSYTSFMRPGSITHVANADGTLKQELSYDAWGRLRDPATHVAYAPGTEPALFLGRGYTGHEYLTWFGLINMNARLYDPALGRFLSPDPYVQTPDFTQSFNRYSYCLNNPLIYSDPTGEKWWHLLIGAALLDPVSAITTATVTAGTTSLSVAALGSSIYATGSLTATIASTTLSAVDFTRIYFGTLFGGNTSWGGQQFENWFNLEFQRFNTIAGTFSYDKKANGFEWPMQVLNNLSGGEHLQDEIGNAFGHLQNIGGYIDDSGYYKGRLIVRLKGDYLWSEKFSGVSYGHYVFGNNIALNPQDAEHNLDLFAHEYGHTYQSRIMGPLYLFRVGIPSAIYQGSTEYDANRRGFGNLGMVPGKNHYKNQDPSSYKWWEWITSPVSWPFMWSWNK